MENADDSGDKPGVVKYGELIVLGYNGADNHFLRNGHSGRKHQSKMGLYRRIRGNGIKKLHQSSVSAPKDSKAVRDSSRHAVSYTYSRHQTVIVEYQENPNTDMFQIGRSSEDQIDFTVVDTWLAAGINGECNGCVRPGMGPEGSSGGGRQYSSTISRYACRILCDRDKPWTVRVYAAGFDASRNIFLGEKATKWSKKNGEVDGLTTNGILILHPSFSDDNHTLSHSESNSGMSGAENSVISSPETQVTEANGGSEGEDAQNPTTSAQHHKANKKLSLLNRGGPMYIWREVSVDGDIYTLRETRSAQKRGDLVREETNELKDGTLIDLCGATLLFRTKEGLASSPSKSELELMLDELNAGKPQCPVNLNTLVVPRRRGARSSTGRHLTPASPPGTVSSSSSDRQPYVYLKCGHVQGKHSWGHVSAKGAGANAKHKCPICSQESDLMLQLTMGMEPAFHLDSGNLSYAFNPCGHVASFATVRYWSRIPLPHGTNSFHPVCPFCTSLLSTEKPFVKLIFQDHCD